MCCRLKKKEQKKLKNRSRQNRVYELGYLISKLLRPSERALTKEELEITNDLSGVEYTYGLK
jgi:predicted nucleotide-binding protein